MPITLDIQDIWNVHEDINGKWVAMTEHGEVEMIEVFKRGAGYTEYTFMLGGEEHTVRKDSDTFEMREAVARFS